MATMVTSTRPVTNKERGRRSESFPDQTVTARNATARRFAIRIRAANRYRIGMWVGLASIAMMFTSLSSAYIVRVGVVERLDPVADAARDACQHGVDSGQQRHARNRATKTESSVDDNATRYGCC